MWKIEKHFLKARNLNIYQSNNQVIGIDQKFFQPLGSVLKVFFSVFGPWAAENCLLFQKLLPHGFGQHIFNEIFKDK